jgi:hypothetical protein
MLEKSRRKGINIALFQRMQGKENQPPMRAVLRRDG